MRTISIETNAVGNFSMWNIVTNHRLNIWNKYLQKSSKHTDNTTKLNTQLSENKITDLIKGTKLHRCLTQHRDVDRISEDSDHESDNSDEEYIPIFESSENSDSEDEMNLNYSLQQDLNVSILSTASTGSSCIKNILR